MEIKNYKNLQEILDDLILMSTVQMEHNLKYVEPNKVYRNLVLGIEKLIVNGSKLQLK